MPSTSATLQPKLLILIYSTLTITNILSFGGLEGDDSTETGKEELLFFEYDITRTKDAADAEGSDMNKRYLQAAEIVDDGTSNPAEKSAKVKGEQTLDILDTLAYGPNYKNENPYPRKFWPEVNPQAAVYAAMVTSIWLAVLTLWLYIRFSGRSYDALFNEEDSDSDNYEQRKNFKAAAATAAHTVVYNSEKSNSGNSSRVDKKVKQVSIVGHIREEDEH